MEDKIKAIERLGLDVPTPQRQAKRFLKSLDPTKHKDMISSLKNQALQNQDTTSPVDLTSMCGLATCWSSKSYSYKSDIPASVVVFNATDKDDNRKAGDKGHKRNVHVNIKDTKPERKVDCCNCGGMY